MDKDIITVADFFENRKVDVDGNISPAYLNIKPLTAEVTKKIHRSTKKYGHDVGLSCAFRQWRAESHCRLIHGYALAVKFVFSASELDRCNWVVDFGSLKSLKQMLQDTFDHTLLVSSDDPEIEWFREAHKRGIARVVELPAAGCEKFAEFIFECTEVWLKDNGYSPRCWLESVEVSEHGANSAIYEKQYL